MKLLSFSPNSAFWLVCVSFLFLHGASGSSEEKGFLRGDGGVSKEGDGDRGLPRKGDSKRLSSLKETGHQLPPEELGGGGDLTPSPAKDAGRQRIVLDLYHAVKAVAWVLSHEQSKVLLKQTVKLVDFVYDPPTPPMPSSATFRVVFILGIDETNLFVLAEGVDVEGLFCLGFSTIRTKASLSSAAAQSAFETELNRHVLSNNTKAEAVKRRASSSSSYLARIDGVEAVTLVGDILVFNTVILFGDFSKNRGYVLSRHGSLPLNTRVYLARRLMVLFLLLQQTGIAHDFFDVRHISMSRGGSFILSILSAFSRFSEQVKKTLLNGSSPFTAPEVLHATQKNTDKTELSRLENASTATKAADMWSLGAMLFYIFTGKFVTHDMTDCSEKVHRLESVSTQLAEVEEQQHDVDSILKASGVPVRWRELILKLLKIKEEDRISADRVLLSFPDLLGLNS
ncbi:hypothetical protein Emed_003062 [Eimeria media]